MFHSFAHRYPVRTTLADHSPCSIRPLQRDDDGVFRTFHQGIPEAERLFVHREVQDGSLVRSWTCDPSYESILPLFAFVDGHAAAFGVLSARPGGWKRHIGKLTLLTNPSFRGLGLIHQLLNELVEAARDRGFTRLESEFNGERTTAIAELAKFGFEELVRLSDYVQDMNAEYHDYVLMGMKLLPDEENMSSAD